jgi:hypothetical protein
MRRLLVHRRGALLAAALVCLLIVMLLTGSVARSMAMRQRASQWDERQSQCFWLTESALARGIARLHADENYAGESWRVTLGPTGAAVTGVADIRVEPVPGESSHRRIVVEARWPDHPTDRVVRNKEFIFPHLKQGAGP